MTPDLFNADRFDAVLLDLDGTLRTVGGAALPGAAELVAALQGAGRPVAILSNSTISPAAVAGQLRRLGMDIDSSHVHTATAAACDWFAERYGPGGRAFNLIGPAVEELLKGRAALVEPPADAAELAAWAEEHRCDAVLIGTPSNAHVTPERQRAALYQLKAGAAAVGACADRVYHSARGLEFGSGGLAAMLGYAATVTPEFAGKPEAVFFRTLCERLGVGPSRCVLVGDNLESDVAGGRGVGMATVLVLGGVSSRADAERGAVRPDAVVESLEEFL